MTLKEKLIVTAYIGVLMVDFSVFQKFASEVLGRPYFSHEFARQEVADKLKKAVEDDFLNICKEGDSQ